MFNVPCFFSFRVISSISALPPSLFVRSFLHVVCSSSGKKSKGRTTKSPGFNRILWFALIVQCHVLVWFQRLVLHRHLHCLVLTSVRISTNTTLRASRTCKKKKGQTNRYVSHSYFYTLRKPPKNEIATVDDDYLGPGGCRSFLGGSRLTKSHFHWCQLFYHSRVRILTQEKTTTKSSTRIDRGV